MAVWADAYRYHLPTPLNLPQTPRERGLNSDMSLWKLCLPPNYMWFKSYELQVMSLKRERENFSFSFRHTERHPGSQFPDQGLNPCPLQWKRHVLTTGLLGNS